MIAGFLNSLGQLVDNVRRRGQVRIAHAKVDNVFALRTSILFELVYDIEDIRRQSLDSIKITQGSDQ